MLLVITTFSGGKHISKASEFAKVISEQPQITTNNKTVSFHLEQRDKIVRFWVTGHFPDRLRWSNQLPILFGGQPGGYQIVSAIIPEICPYLRRLFVAGISAKYDYMVVKYKFQSTKTAEIHYNLIEEALLLWTKECKK